MIFFRTINKLFSQVWCMTITTSDCSFFCEKAQYFFLKKKSSIKIKTSYGKIS